MPNTRSAERRMRSSARRHSYNQSVKSRLKTLQNTFEATLVEGDRTLASQALSQVTSALDKAAKSGIIPKATASRKKSRLATRLVKAES